MSERATCPWCEHSVVVLTRGGLRFHYGDDRRPCRGSGATPAAAQAIKAAHTRKERQR